MVSTHRQVYRETVWNHTTKNIHICQSFFFKSVVAQLKLERSANVCVRMRFKSCTNHTRTSADMGRLGDMVWFGFGGTAAHNCIAAYSMQLMAVHCLFAGFVFLLHLFVCCIKCVERMSCPQLH